MSTLATVESAAERRARMVVFSVGCGLLGLAVALYFVLNHLLDAELARTQGEDNLGGGVLAMFFGIGIFATAAAGLVILLIGWAILTAQKLRNRTI